MIGNGKDSRRGDETASDAFDLAMRDLRRRPRKNWLGLARHDQSDRWRSGVGVLAEEYFAKLPELRADDEESLILICGESQLRDELGAGPSLIEYQERFPELSQELAIQFDVNCIFQDQDQSQGQELNEEEQDHAPDLPGYELLNVIGRGASGVVYQARQLSLGRMVAVKILENPGSDERRSVRQHQEAELLARLRHPNVVHVYEVIKHRGHVHLVMELIDGPTLHVKSHSRPWESCAAADLVVTLAEAVHAVHEAGILHRDLKPSNVLLTAEGQPKISDFGLAKLRFDDNFLTTQDSILGTPSYMSPEQAGGDLGGIGPATDIYSLGAILYELLTGRPPFLGTTVFDTLSMIRERDPVPPRQLQPTTPRDIETICLKCLEKNSLSRYPGARELANDLRRFLEGKSILARQNSPVERLGRSIRRNKVACSAAVAVLASLVMGLCVATWGLLREQSARQRAESARNTADAAARKSQQVATFLTDMLKGVEPSVALGQDTAMLRQILDTTAERVGNDLQEQPEVEAELRSTIGTTYLRLGEYAKAEAMYRDALRLRISLFGKIDESVAGSWNDLARVLINAGDAESLPEAETSVRQALEIRRELFGDAHQDTALSVYLLASILYRQGKLVEAETAHRDALAMRINLFGDTHQDVAASLNNLALVLIDEKKYSEAEEALRKALAVQQKVLREDHPDIADSYLNLANALSRQGKLVEAETVARESLRIRKKLFGDDHAVVAASLSRLAGILAKQDKPAEADRLYREVLAMHRRISGDVHPSVGTSLDNFADLLASQGRLAEAEARYREALTIRREVLGNQHPDTLVLLLKLAVLLRNQGRLAEAEALYRERLAGERARVPPSVVRVGNSLTGLTLTLLYAEKFAEAEPVAREFLAITTDKEWYPSRWFRFYAQSLVGASLLGQKKYAAAEPLLVAGYEGMVQNRHPMLTEHAIRSREALERLVQLYEATGQSDKSAQWNERLRELESTVLRQNLRP